MANSYHTQDLVKSALQMSGENTDGSSSRHELALTSINRVYHSILSGSNEFDPDIGDAWSWARTGKSTTLLAYHSTGTVSLTNGSANGTFSSGPTLSQAGRFLKIDNRATYYEILTHTAGATAFVLKTNYLEATGSGLTYKSIPLRYSLGAKILRLVEPLRIYSDRALEYLEDSNSQGRIYGVDIDQLREKWPLRSLQNDVPTRFATDTKSESAWYILVNKYVSSDTKVDFDVIEIQPDLLDTSDSIPLIPREHREVLSYGAAYYLNTDKNDLDKAKLYFGLTKAKLLAMHKAETKERVQTSANFGRLVPRRDQTSVPFWLINR